MTFSVIIPVYNRRDEIEELLDSLATNQSAITADSYQIEVIIVEDGSTENCRDICNRYAEKGLDIKYFYKENEGRSIARNYGMEHAKGDWFIFFDSDCVIPKDYFEKLSLENQLQNLDCFGGPDSAHESFSDTQKAINYAMTSFLTTGGIRGGKISMEKFTPRTFNMGFRKEIYRTVGGFREMYSEDIDMSTRIRNAGYRIGLLPEQKVYHKRRVNFKKFFRQVNTFGRSRITLKFLYPGSLKLVHLLPAVFVIGCAILLLFSVIFSPWWLLPLGVYVLAIFFTALFSTKSFKISFLAVPASFIQLFGYGTGFISAYTKKVILGKGRDINEEILARKGK